jgi:hypothetical protein
MPIMREFVNQLCRLHRECMLNLLEQKCIGIYGRVGENCKDETLSQYPNLGSRDKVPCDWVAYGFKGHDFWKLHLGVPFSIEGGIASFSTKKGEATFRTGLHLNSNYYVDKLKNLIQELQLSHDGEIPKGEQHYQKPPIGITFAQAGPGFQTFLDESLALYQIVYKTLKAIKPE